MKKPLFLFFAGMILVLAGAFLKMQHLQLGAGMIMASGMIMEVLGLILFVRHYRQSLKKSVA